MSITVAGKVALVTGAGRGIGKGIARVLGSEGAKVLVSNRSEVTARAVAAAIRDAGGQASHVACDVTKEADLRRAVSTVIERYGRLDILAHNAGIYPIAPIEAMSEQLWDEVIDTNLKGTFFAAKAAFEVMKPQGCGRIIITSSITGPRTGIAGLAHYAASKAGINGFIKVAAIEFARFGVTVNAIEPGTIATEGVVALGEAYLQRAAQALPIKRLGTVEDCGYAVLFLASDQAAYITGQTIIVDGGQLLPESPNALEVEGA
jgi:3-oxoacyl-[acyl-carrier protein] reductase